MILPIKYFIITLVLTIIYIILYHWANQIDVILLDTHIQGPTVLIVGGTHGNEPAGSIAIDKINLNLKRGKLVLIPRANKFGLFLNTRWLPHRLFNNDLNRNYPKLTSQTTLEPISTKIAHYVKQADFIIDLHEGWDFNRLNNLSLGSGLYPGNTYEAINIAYRSVDKLNKIIDTTYKKFVVGLNNHPELNSLRSYCVLLGKHYILIETTGQNNIQPINIRVKQHQFLIHSILMDLDIIE